MADGLAVEICNQAIETGCKAVDCGGFICDHIHLC
jgi:hypothetical protein